MNNPTEPALDPWVRRFLADLAQAQRSPHTLRAYAADLAPFCAFGQQAPRALTPAGLDAFFAQFAHLSPATRARKHAALASFLAWAVRQALIPADPLGAIAPGSRPRRRPAR